MALKLKWAMILTMLILSAILWGIFWIIMSIANIGGNNVIFMTFAFVGFMLAFQWAIGPTLLKKMSRMQPCTDPALLEITERLAKKAKIKTPALYLVPNPSPNAFAFGRTQKSSAIALHTGLIETLSTNEVEAVIAHETGHIKHRDVLVMTLASALPMILFYLVYFAAMFGGNSKDNRGNYWGAYIGAMVAQFIGTLPVLYLSRTREYYADKHSALNTNVNDMINALTKINAASRARPVPMIHKHIKTFYINDPTARSFTSSSFAEVFMTHPPIHKRIKALEKLQMR